MENALAFLGRENPSAMSSPRSHGAASQSSSSSNGGPTPVAPRSVAPPTRSEPSHYPTTFVQADSSNFKHVVQMLTGSSETVKQPSSRPAADLSSSRSFAPAIKKHSFKLYERRNNLKQGLVINPSVPRVSQNYSSFSHRFSPRNPEILSPSILDFPNLALVSPVTPLLDDPFNRSSPATASSPEEEPDVSRVDGFYLHPYPKTTSRESQPPQLLQLFPLTSPSISGSYS